MTEKLRQSLSAAMDDEADAFELRRVLDELGRDDELRSLWDRYHLIGSALRGERTRVPPELRERLWQALDADSELAGTLGGNVDVADLPNVAVAGPAAVSVARVPSHLGRYTALAVAASVAFAVVLAFNGMWGIGQESGVELAGNDTGAAPLLVGPPAPVATATEVASPRVQLGSRVSASDVQRAQAYILHHTQQQALNQGGVMSFVKLATYEAP